MIDRESTLPLLRMERVLLVEGQDDKHVVEHIYRKRFGSELPFNVKDMDGFPRLCDAIVPELKAPGQGTVGIIVDANDGLQRRWSAVKARLERARPDIRIGEPIAGGTVIDSRSGPIGGGDDGDASPIEATSGSGPRIGIWLWPDNQSPGELENFVARMIPDDDPVWPLSESFIDSVPTEVRKFAEGKTTRAKVHAWLATRKEPRRMGTGIRVGDLGIDALLAVQFADWLQQLAGDRGR